MIDTAIILVGGLGTRLRPLTDTIPKPLLPIKNKPMVQHCMENMRKHGIKKIILSIGYKAELIRDYFKEGNALDLEIAYVYENEPLGTGGAVKKAAEKLSQSFFLAWGDNLMEINWTALYKKYQQEKTLVTMALTQREDVENFGVATLKNDKIIGFVEKPNRENAPSNLINAGAFVIEPRALVVLPEGKSSIERDCFEKLAGQGQITAFKHQGQWFPTDTLEKYYFAEKNFKVE